MTGPGNGSTQKEFKREPLIAPRIQLAEYASNRWRVVLEQGTTIDEIKEPKFWAHVASKLRQFDDITAIEESGAFRADLMVTACQRTWATVVVLGLHKLHEGEVVAAAQPQPEAEFSVGFAGPHHKWRVVRKSDNEVLHKGAQTEAEANTWLSDYRKTIGA